MIPSRRFSPRPHRRHRRFRKAREAGLHDFQEHPGRWFRRGDHSGQPQGRDDPRVAFSRVDQRNPVRHRSRRRHHPGAFCPGGDPRARRAQGPRGRRHHRSFRRIHGGRKGHERAGVPRGPRLQPVEHPGPDAPEAPGAWSPSSSAPPPPRPFLGTCALPSGPSPALRPPPRSSSASGECRPTFETRPGLNTAPGLLYPHTRRVGHIAACRPTRQHPRTG